MIRMKRFLVCLLLLASAMVQAGTKHYYYTDPQGTVLAKADAQGNIVATYDYAPYGAQVIGAVPPEGPTGYTGHVNDAESGLVYMQQRYYDPEQGRFISSDPITPVPGDINIFSRYTYANDNPVRYADPTGRCVDADFGCGALGRTVAANPDAFSGAAPYAAAAAGIMAAGPLAGIAIEAAITNPVTAVNIVNGAAEALAGDVLGGASLTVGAAGAAKVADKAADGAHVFWSGGTTARNAAEGWARQNGATTLEMSSAGKAVESATNGMPWAQAKPLWDKASATFANGTKGAAHVFQNSAGVSLESTWRNVEYPILKQKGIDIIYHTAGGE